MKTWPRNGAWFDAYHAIVAFQRAGSVSDGVFRGAKDDYSGAFSMSSRFVVGIDLGTTNSALAYVDTGAKGDAVVRPFPVPQVVAQGSVGERPLLPSFLYLPGTGEQPAGALKLPWDANRDYCVGEYARVFGSQVPTRLVASAKSWLSQ